MSEIEISKVNKYFGNAHVIKDVSIQIKNQSFTVLVGPSGCGKSTLLRMIAGLEFVNSGTIAMDGLQINELPPKDRDIAMVFQSYALYPHMTVYNNMAFGLKLEKRPKEEINQRVLEAARILQIEDYLSRKPRQLSGGQRQRVAIGRAITRNPKVFLFDEPLSNLDAALRSDMRIELTELHAKLKATMIYVTHDQIEAMTLADSIVVLNDGLIEQVGSPLELYKKPQTEFVAGFIGSPKMNFLRGKIAERLGGDTIGIRPEHIVIDSKRGDLEVFLRHLEHLGPDTLCYFNSEYYGPILVREAGIRSYNKGDKMHVRFDNENIHCFKNGVLSLNPA